MVEPYYSRSQKVVIWCSDSGSLEVNGIDERVVAKAFQDGTLFLTIGEKGSKLSRVQSQLMDNK